ncbi:hypothetical protein BDM02DRAFT_3189169 [Thelephora ganbajun]|uniref:Uncharacterized protein n=1 Tax=Thelephora ganbajun TaxID=370292 RepID=A0ACB6Z8L8_THEGA|nr:hypothetical protein BDM02DRAFT_3189169 [Thelephora ganbajun]
MRNVQWALNSVIGALSDQDYEQSFASCRFWFEIGQAYSKIPSDLIFETIWTKRATGPSKNLIYQNAHLVLRLADDVESDHILAPYNVGLRSRLCAKILQEFFDGDTIVMYDGREVPGCSYVNVNLIAHCANLGCIDESVVRNHVLQSLISYPKLYDYQADALIILFKLAGATFEAYADPSVVDRCFELLKNHYNRYSDRGKLVQGVVELRERGWEGLPPPPVFTAGIPKPTGANQNDPVATPIVTSLGLPNRDLEPQIPQPSPFEPVTVPETDTIPASPVIQSPSISIATLSDFTIADASDDESPTDPTVITPHGTFYLEDGNVEVLCGNTLFRVHTSILSFHSPALRHMFAQTTLATPDSPNGCPRILSSDTAVDFATLLNMIYLPRFPERSRVPDFNTFASLLRITAKYEMPAVRSHFLEVIRDAYPETFEGVTPTKLLGENVFDGPTPHPNEVLNLFVQQKVTSALPMAYYMAARRGLELLMDRRLPQSATLSPEILQSAIGGLMALREVEFNETHRLVFERNVPQRCPGSNCPSLAPASSASLTAYREVFDHIVGSSQRGTKVLEIPEFHLDSEGGVVRVFPDICSGCVRRWESGHANVRKKAWMMLPGAFGLKT